jgi:uracil-DNA glycosylase family 4
MKIVKPEFIITLGNCSTAYVFSKAHLPLAGITAVHGKFRQATLDGVQVTVFPTFHPAAALYSRKYKDQTTADFELLKKELEKRAHATRD